jgi:hypothetical protein
MQTNQSNLTYLSIIWIMALSLQGCATTGQSLALGGGVGAGTGALIGAIADPGKNGELRTRNVLIGTALGGMAGMVTGTLIHDNTEEKQRDAYVAGQKSVENRRSAPPPGPEITQSQIEIDWIEGHAIGNRWVDGHYERIIKEPPHWETDSK